MDKDLDLAQARCAFEITLIMMHSQVSQPAPQSDTKTLLMIPEELYFLFS